MSELIEFVYREPTYKEYGQKLSDLISDNLFEKVDPTLCDFLYHRRDYLISLEVDRIKKNIPVIMSLKNIFYSDIFQEIIVHFVSITQVPEYVRGFELDVPNHITSFYELPIPTSNEWFYEYMNGGNDIDDYSYIVNQYIEEEKKIKSVCEEVF